MVKFVNHNILKIIQNLNPKKAHGHDKISIRMLKLCDDSLCRPLELIFKDCLTNGKFPSDWKKGSIVPVHKKNDKQCLSNYRPISLLPICNKIFERLIFDEMFQLFVENNLISQHQSGFKPDDSCINQLLSITNEIHQLFDDGFDVRSVFLGISKAFDKVRHDGLIFKLKQNGISGNLSNLLSDFLRNRKQTVVLNGKSSSWADVTAGVPQGSILGPLLSFIFNINDLADGLSSIAKFFADDTSLFSVVHNANTTAKELNNDLVKISNWAYQWKISFNPDPSKQAQEIVFSRKVNKDYHTPLAFNNNNVPETDSQKHLGIILDNHLSFPNHLKTILNKVNKPVGLLRKLHNILPRPALLTTYKSFIRPHLDYGDIIYDQAYSTSLHQKLELLQYNACLAITGAIRGTSSKKLHEELGLESLQLRRWFRKLFFFYKFFSSEYPNYLFKLIPLRSSNYRITNIHNIPILKTRHFFSKTLSSRQLLLNGINIRNSSSFNIFRKSILKFIKSSANSLFNCHNPKGIKFITRLRLGLSYLREHKFKHSFQGFLNPFCSCGLDIESTVHFPLHCHMYITERHSPEHHKKTLIIISYISVNLF